MPFDFESLLELFEAVVDEAQDCVDGDHGDGPSTDPDYPDRDEPIRWHV